MRAIILYSVGSPETLSKQCLKQYLDRFLSDKLVVRIPGFLWQPILHSFILTTRPERMLQRYAAVFENGENPYLKSMENLSRLLEDILNPTLTASTLAAPLSSISSVAQLNQNIACSADKSSLADTTSSADKTSELSTSQPPQDTTDQALNNSAVHSTANTANSNPATDSIVSATNVNSGNDVVSSGDGVVSSSSGVVNSGVNATLEQTEASTNNQAVSESDGNICESLVPSCMVRCAYAFSHPSLKQTVLDCVNAGADEIITIPLFPQYSDTTSKRPLLVLREMQKRLPTCTLKIVRSYCEHELYIKHVADITRHYLEQAQKLSSKAPHLLITYHSLPQSYIKLGDPYLKECQTTTKALVQALNLTEDQYSVGYQSKMSPMSWLKPYIEEVCQELIEKHKTNLVVLAPGFSIDCLETLYDLGHGLRQQFLTQGGEFFTLIPCLNESAQHADLMKALIEQATPVNCK